MQIIQTRAKESDETTVVRGARKADTCSAKTKARRTGCWNARDVKIGGTKPAAQYGLLEIVVRAGDGSPWHVHPDEDEWFYVLDGEITF